MSSDGKRLLADWARLAERAGWSIKIKNGHRHWRSPDGAYVVTATTPGEGRAIQNARAQLRRAGLSI